MKVRHKTEVTVQRERTLIIRKRKSCSLAECAECGAALMTPEEAALFSGKSPREIYREIENGTLYFTELAGGELLVCSHLPVRERWNYECEKENENEIRR